jgi:adenosylhomocysteine nucleosidase
MSPVLLLAPDPDEAKALLKGFIRRGIHHEDVRLGSLDCVLLPSVDMLLAVGGNGKAQYGIQAQYLIDRHGTELLACVGAAGRLTEAVQVGDIVLGTATVEHDYKAGFNPKKSFPLHDADPTIMGEFLRLAESTAFPFQVHFGVIASGDEDIVDPIRAAELQKATNALCVAWEGSAGARAARLNGLPFVEIRGITDAANGDAARSFHANVSDVMFNVVELVLAWSLMRRSAA